MLLFPNSVKIATQNALSPLFLKGELEENAKSRRLWFFKWCDVGRQLLFLEEVIPALCKEIGKDALKIIGATNYEVLTLVLFVCFFFQHKRSALRTVKNFFM